METKKHDSIEDAFNAEQLQGGSIAPRPLQSVATASNSTTIAELERKKRINRIIILSLSSLATVAMVIAGALLTSAPIPAIVIGSVAIVMYIVSIIVAFVTNSMTPEEIERLVSGLAGASATVAGIKVPPPSSASEKKDGAP